MDDATLLKKFDAMVLPVIGQRKRDRLVDAVMNIDNETDMANFMRLMIMVDD